MKVPLTIYTINTKVLTGVTRRYQQLRGICVKDSSYLCTKTEGHSDFGALPLTCGFALDR